MFDTKPCSPGKLDELPLERIEHELTQLASHINAGTCRWLELVAEFDRREGWGSWECRSCAEWISWRCAVAPRTAREHVRVARAMGELPRIREEFSRGALSYAKVKALTRVADSDSEGELLELAHFATAAQLERMLRAYRRIGSAEANDTHEGEYLAWSWEEDGSLSVRGRLAAEDGALLLRALEAARDRRWARATTTRASGRRNRRVVVPRDHLRPDRGPLASPTSRPSWRWRGRLTFTPIGSSTRAGALPGGRTRRPRDARPRRGRALGARGRVGDLARDGTAPRL